MYDFKKVEKEIDEAWPEIEVELKQSPYYSEPTAKGYFMLADELEQEVEALNAEKDFIRPFRKYRELKQTVLDCVETLDEEIKEWKCRIRRLRNIGQKLKITQKEEGNGASPSFQPA